MNKIELTSFHLKQNYDNLEAPFPLAEFQLKQKAGQIAQLLIFQISLISIFQPLA
jgi:hypothetical protein